MKNQLVMGPVSLRIILCLSSAMFSCSGSLPSDPKIKHINGLKIEACIIPAHRRVAPELKTSKGHDGTNKSLKNYSDNITVLLAISADETGSTIGDIAWKGISGYDEYKERMHYLNFQIQEDVSLSIGEKKFKPVLSHLETGHELKHSRNILFVFSPSEPEDIEIFRTARLLDITYEDRVFNTGVTHFRLKQGDFNN